MQAAEYQRAARTTAIYPASVAIYYPTLGLCGEVGELANKVKKLLRGDSDFTDEKKADFRKELGDVAWYIAAITSDMGICLESIALSARDLDPPELHNSSLSSVILRMQVPAGQIAEEVADSAMIGTLSFSVKICRRIRPHLVYLIRCMAVIAGMLGTTLEDICRENFEKLSKRKEAGTLKGDGDSR